MKQIAVLSMLATSLFAKESKVLLFAGSTREGSYNQKLIDELALQLKQKDADINVIRLKDYPIPFYDADLEKSQGMPENAKRVRQQMIESDLIVISTPEYNASVPAVLKNTLDWASRAEEGGPSREAYKGKQFILMSASPSQGGGARALAHLKTIVENVGGNVISSDFSLKNAHEVIADNKALTKKVSGIKF